MASSSTTYTSGTGTNVTSSYGEWYRELQKLLKDAQALRVPQGTELEESSSDAIAALLNPPNQFTDVDRQGAELAASRGVSGSGAGAGTVLRMTDEERLRRIALGQEMFTAALDRNPVPDLPDIGKFIVTPYQQSLIDLQRRELELEEKKYRESRTGGNRPTSSTGSPNLSAGQGFTPGDTSPGQFPIDYQPTFGTGEDRSTWLDSPGGGTGAIGGVPIGTTAGVEKYWNWPGV